MIYLPLFAVLILVCPLLSAIAVRRSLSVRWHPALLSVFIFYGLLPLLVAWAGISLADRFGCTAENIVFQCPDSPQLSGLITAMVFAHWLAIATLLSAALGSIGLLVSFCSQVNASRQSDAVSASLPAAFYRSRRHSVIAGLCAAIAQRWQLPVFGVRAVTVAASVPLSGLALGIYLWCWLAFPLEPSSE